jgi:hypothetical protein
LIVLSERVIYGVTMETKNHTAIDRTRAAELLTAACQLQAAFWDTLSELEDALDGIEVSGTRDLSETTIDEIIEEAGLEDGE